MTRPMQPHVARNQGTRPLVVCLFALSLFTLSLLAQPAAKRPLAHTDYDTWRTIQTPQLSRDGKLLAYALNPQDADGEVVARVLATGLEWRYPRGHRPDAPATAPSDGETGDRGSRAADEAWTARGGRPYTEDQGRGGRGGAAGGGAAGVMGLAFSPDSRFLAFQIFPTKAEGDAARKDNRRPAEMPQNAMGVMDLTTGKADRVERVRRFALTEQGAAFVAYLLEPKPEPSAAQAGATAVAGEAAPQRGRTVGAEAGRGGGGRQGSTTGGRRTPARPEYGSDLVVRNLADKTEKTIPDVLDFAFSKDGKFLTYTVASRKPETNGVYRLTVGTADNPVAILTGKGKYTRPTWDEKQAQLVFLSDRDDGAARQPKQKIFYWNGQGTAAELVNSDQASTVGSGMVIAERAGLTFSQDGTKLFFGVAPPGAAPQAETTTEETTPATPVQQDEDKVNADLWHWKDDFVQPMQKVRAEQERNRTYRAVVQINTRKIVQLADATMAEVTTTADGRWGLGSDDRAYRKMVDYDGTYNDYYLVNTADGTRRQLLTKQRSGASWSPNGRYVLYFDAKNWNTISIPDGRAVNLTKDLGVNFWQETNDTPGGGGAYERSPVWTRDEKYVLLGDRYDIWQIAPDGSGAKNLTDGLGRKEKLQFRVVRVDQQERGVDPGIDPAQPLLLRVDNEWTHDTGFYRDKINGGPPQKLLMASKNFSQPTKAKDADVYLLTASTFNEFPDLHVSGPTFTDMKKVSNANPQKAQLLWGTAELVRFKNVDGVPLSATLYKPENFDPSKKYPMMVYIYELLSNGVNNFVNPGPGHSINVSYYVSNGYLVLEPDIVYTIGHPGRSALKCVLPAVQSIVDKGFVDEKAIGIQGHSWGGYQIAYMITQTNRFRAVEAGAPVSNMTSAYSGIRWGSGLPRQFQYEKTQSRIGVPLYDNPLLYIENSAVFHAANVQTPILILHNDADDAVPWYQGIEYYLALRRLGKEVYMFTYNGEPHGLRRRADMKDYTVRMQQFFDHFLKGAPAPEWMEKGIPYLDRDKEKEKIKAVYEVKPATKPSTDKKK